MRGLRLIVGCWFAMLLLAAPWGADRAGAQASSAQRSCLTFHEVHPSLTAREALQRGIPTGYRVYPAANGRDQEQLLREVPVAHAGDMADAQAGFDSRTHQPIVTFRFDAAGARKLALFTRSNVGRPFAIVVDGQVVSAPVIQEPILRGEGQISGNFTVAEAKKLADRIRSGTCAEVGSVPPSLAVAG